MKQSKSDILAGALCILGGLTILLSFAPKMDHIMFMGFGFYLIGKGIFAIKALGYLRDIKNK